MPLLTPDSRRGPRATTFIDMRGKRSRFGVTNVTDQKGRVGERMNTGGA